VRIAEIDLPVAPYEGDPLDWPAGAGDAFFVRLPGETAATLRAWLTARLGEKDRRYADFFLGHGLDMILKLAYCATMRRCTAMGIPPVPARRIADALLAPQATGRSLDELPWASPWRHDEISGKRSPDVVGVWERVRVWWAVRTTLVGDDAVWRESVARAVDTVEDLCDITAADVAFGMWHLEGDKDEWCMRIAALFNADERAREGDLGGAPHAAAATDTPTTVAPPRSRHCPPEPARGGAGGSLESQSASEEVDDARATDPSKVFTQPQRLASEGPTMLRRSRLAGGVGSRGSDHKLR